MRISAVDEASEMDEVAKANPMTGRASSSKIVYVKLVVPPVVVAFTTLSIENTIVSSFSLSESLTTVNVVLVGVEPAEIVTELEVVA